MKTNMYSIYDAKAEAFMQPFFSNTHGLAIRTFTSHVNNPETIFHKHPGDFSLFHIGAFEEDNAKVTPELSPLNLGVALEFIEQQTDPRQMELVQ